MKILLDTNVLLSAFITGGRCAELIEDAVHAHELYYTEFIAEEMRGKLRKKFKTSDAVALEAAEFLRRFFRRGETAVNVEAVCRDPDDDQVLADAAANHIEVVVTGDQDLLTLKEHRGVRMLSPKDYWSF